MTIRKPIVVVGSSNGSQNYGDDMMWLATTNAVRKQIPETPVITDSFPRWLPPVGGVETLPFMHDALLRYRMTVTKSRLANKAQAAFGLTVNRDALRRGLVRQEELADGAPTSGIERRWEKAIARSQAMIFSGAGGLNDTFALHAIAGWGMMIALAHRHGVPVIMLGQGVGPLVDPSNREALRRSLERCDFITTRDHVSAQIVNRIAPQVPVNATIDWAVLETPSETTQEAVDQYLGQHHIGDFVAVSLHDWRPADTQSREKVARLLQVIVAAADERDCSVVLVPNCVGVRRADDRVFMREAASALDTRLRDRVVSLPEDMTAFETRALIARAKGVFASRYHPGVFALAAGTPSTGICYDDYYVQKHAGALSWYGEQSRIHLLDEQHTLDWWMSGIDVSGSSAARRLQVTNELRDECMRPLNDWIAAKKIR